MPGKKLNYNDVFAMGLKLPGVVTETNKFGTRLKLRGKLLACPAINKSAEPDSLMVRISQDKREELLFTQPEIFYVTPHYVGHACVVVRLGNITRKGLQSLLETALAQINAKA